MAKEPRNPDFEDEFERDETSDELSGFGANEDDGPDMVINGDEFDDEPDAGSNRPVDSGINFVPDGQLGPEVGDESTFHEPEPIPVRIEDPNETVRRYQQMYPHCEVTYDGKTIRISQKLGFSYSNINPSTKEPTMAQHKDAAPGAEDNPMDEYKRDTDAAKAAQKRSLWIAAIVILVLLAIGTIWYFGSRSGAPAPTATGTPATSTPASATPDPRIAELEQQVRERDLRILNLEKEVAVANALETELRKERDNLKLRHHDINGNVEIRSEDGLNHYVLNGEHPDVIRLRKEIEELKKAHQQEIKNLWWRIRKERSSHKTEMDRMKGDYKDKLAALQVKLEEALKNCCPPQIIQVQPPMIISPPVPPPMIVIPPEPTPVVPGIPCS